MEIKEVGGKIADTITKNPVPILLGGGALLFAYVAMSQSKLDKTELITPTGVSGYPDMDTNANVIIDEVNNNTRVESDRVIDSVGDYIDKGKQEIIDNANENANSVMDKITDESGKLSGQITTSTGQIISNQNTNAKKVINTVKKEVKNTTSKKKSSSKSRNKSSAKYYKKANYGGNSIVDALKKIGANSSYSNRAKIAKANGIKNYRGTASQNLKMLSLLKKGKLKRY